LGLLNLGGDDVIIKENIVTQNVSAGIALAQLPAAIAALDPRIDPFPDNNQIRDNVSLRNGSSPDPKLAPLPGVDLLWDFSGSGNCWASNVSETSFPSPLPACHQTSDGEATTRSESRKSSRSKSIEARIYLPKGTADPGQDNWLLSRSCCALPKLIG